MENDRSGVYNVVALAWVTVREPARYYNATTGMRFRDIQSLGYRLAENAAAAGREPLYESVIDSEGRVELEGNTRPARPLTDSERESLEQGIAAWELQRLQPR